MDVEQDLRTSESALRPVSELLGALLDVDLVNFEQQRLCTGPGSASDHFSHTEDPEALELLAGLTIEELRLDLPIELDVLVDENGQVELQSAPPTQQIETSVMPVLHRLMVRMVHGPRE